MTNADFQSARFQLSDFSLTQLVQANLDSSDLAGSNFESANLTGASLNHAVLTEVNFQQANLSGTRLQNGRSAASVYQPCINGVSLWHAGCESPKAPAGAPRSCMQNEQRAQKVNWSTDVRTRCC